MASCKTDFLCTLTPCKNTSFEHMILFQQVQHINLLYGFFTNHYYHFVDSVSTHVYNQLGPVPEWSISTNPGLKFCSIFVLNLPMYCLKKNFALSLPNLEVKAQQYFVSLSYMFSDKKPCLKFGLIPG